MLHEVRMPVLSQSMIQGQVVEWLFKEGDLVGKGATLVIVESDKATHELEAQQGGVLRKILVEAGTEVDVDTPLAVIADPGEAIPTGENPAQTPTTQADTPPTQARPNGRKSVSPLAKRVAKELGIDASLVAGSGAGGMVIENDIRSYAEQHKASPQGVKFPAQAAKLPVQAPSKGDQVIPLIGQRGRIAERIAHRRRTAADVTTVMDVDMGQVVSIRQTTKHSFTAYVAWAAIQALRKFPQLNAWLADERILVKSAIHLGVAVAIEGALVVPVIRDAGRMSVADIDRAINALGEKARAGQLTPDDLKGSTFTVTNSGVFGSLFFTPIINLPEVAILGMGKVADTPVVRLGEVVPGKLMYLSLSYDHRAVDGAMAVQFLQAIKYRLEKPE